MSNIFIGLKKTCLGVLERGDRDKDNETGFERGRRNKNVNYSAPFACRSFALKYLPMENTS